MTPVPNIAIVVSHPIQHFCPQYVSFAKNKNCTLKVFFGSALGYKKYVDTNFNQEISWGNLQLDQFDHVFLNGDAVIQADKQLDAGNLEKELAGFNPDIVIVYGYFQQLQRRAYQWAVNNKVRMAYISDSEMRHKSNPLKDILKSFFLRRYFSKINYFLSVGNANEAFYAKHGVTREKLVRMHFPIDVEAYKISYLERQSLRDKIRRQYGIGQDEVVISVVGKLTSWKNQDHLIDAVGVLEKRDQPVHLFILGSGEMKAAWEKQSHDSGNKKIYFPGFVNIEELPAYYAATDIYVHPASMEPHSIAVSEAIYMGCPVILSDRCGSYGDEDDVQVGRNGFVFEFGNMEELVDEISRLAKDKLLREKMGAYSHEIAVGFQQRAHCDVLKELVERVNRL